MPQNNANLSEILQSTILWIQIRDGTRKHKRKEKYESAQLSILSIFIPSFIFFRSVAVEATPFLIFWRSTIQLHRL